MSRRAVKNLFDYVEVGNGLNDFLEAFPGVIREQATTSLDVPMAWMDE